MESLNITHEQGQLSGTYDQRFASVAEYFVENFSHRDEVGASVCLTFEGETVVDLWGGTADSQNKAPWTEDTMSVVYSSTKGAVALAAHALIDAGELDLDQSVSHYWPEFACAGKESATVRMMLNHSAGVPCIREPLRDDGCCDWEYMTAQVAAEEAYWKPGTHGYHMMTFGWTVGELIRRVAGQSLGTFFRQAVAAPAEADFWIGLPETEEARVARMIRPKLVKGAPIGEFTQALMQDKTSIQHLAFFNNGGYNPNSRACHAAEIGGGGGIGNARGLARIYAASANEGAYNNHQFLKTDSIARMCEVSCAGGEDATLLLPTRFGLGFMKSMDNRYRQPVDRSSAILGATAFGHVGAGGSIGFADPAAHISFGYVMNQMGPGILLNERGQGLVDRVYQSLGYVSNVAGVWHR